MEAGLFPGSLVISQHALLNGLAAVFSRCDDDWLPKSKQMFAAVERWDHGMSTNFFQQLPFKEDI